MAREFERNRERYQFMKWGMQAFATFRVVPPGVGIVHQVNLEHLFHGVRQQAIGSGRLCFPDTLVGTDSHTTMINGVGVVGWGVGGIEAEAAMLGQPVYFLTPDVVGVELSGRLREGVTATDLVLTVTELLRREKVVGTFVEYFGEGAGSLSVTDRATLANMAPEYGATMGFFPVDEKTVDYMRATGRSEEDCVLFEAYFRAQGLFGMPRADQIDYSRSLRLDLSTIVPSLAGPKRPQDRIALPAMASRFDALLSAPEAADGFDRPAASLGQRYPTERMGIDLGHGDVLIAAITSCTNTSNPAVMIAAGLLARKAVAKGLRVRPHIKTSLAPGSRVVTDYLDKAGLLAPLAELGFALVGYGCTTCIGNAGDLDPAFNKAIVEHQLIAAAVLSGNRNFEARIHPNLRANYLASPPLVVAFAIAGRVNIDLDSEALGVGSDGREVYLRDVWPTSEEINAVLPFALDPETFRRRYADVTADQELWKAIPAPVGEVYNWATINLHRPPTILRTARRTGRRHPRGASAVAARRLGDNRPYLAGRLIRRGDTGRSMAQGAGRQPCRIQFLRRTPWPPRGDDAWHFRQRAHSQPDAARRCRGAPTGRRLHAARRAADKRLCRRDEPPSTRHADHRRCRRGVWHRLVARLGGQGDASAWGAGGDCAQLRKDSPCQPGRHGRAAVAVRRRRFGSVTWLARRRKLRHPWPWPGAAADAEAHAGGCAC
jgi:aconitate hydratase